MHGFPWTSLRRTICLAWIAALGGFAAGPPASAAVAIGQLAPDSTLSQCTFITDRLQPTVTSGNSYVVPSIPPAASLVISSWSYNATAGGAADQTMTMKVFRKVADPATYQVVAHDGPRAIAGGSLNTFSTSIPVSSGDVLGTGQPTHAATACIFSAPGDASLLLLNGGAGGNLADGASGPFDPAPNLRVNVSAVVAPSNAFTIGTITRSKKKGTATINLSVPNPGELTGSGNGVKAASTARRAVTSKAVSPGQTQLLIRAKGKKKRKLNETGKVKLSVAVAYTPTGGDVSTRSVKVKLKRKR